ncbi:chemotaxis protein CheX [Haliovirga abyssi]|uniref:Chemotaxis protein CheX n=1 Tax=Haliovirga abyssi TaxID=2996794 RepID=A0AAU9DRP8_9FUSO|nr:chemotaxis protein CheX [Haliovirga abyssi]BDU49629.1 chemotaxis protein CheX [Haliovirga abyssi]
MAVNLEYINPFLSSVINVMNEMIDEKPIKSEVKMQKTNFKSEGISTIVGITEGGKGNIIIDMKQETAIKIAEIVNEEEYGKLTDFVFITLAEIGNMIAGNGITVINNKNSKLNLRLTPPSIFAGDDLEIDSPKLSSIGVKFKLSFGEISLNVAFEGVEV